MGTTTRASTLALFLLGSHVIAGKVAAKLLFSFYCYNCCCWRCYCWRLTIHIDRATYMSYLQNTFRKLALPIKKYKINIIQIDMQTLHRHIHV